MEHIGMRDGIEQCGWNKEREAGEEKLNIKEENEDAKKLGGKTAAI